MVVVLHEGLELGVVLMHQPLYLLWRASDPLWGAFDLKKPGNSVPLLRRWTVYPRHDLESRCVGMEAAADETNADAEPLVLALIGGDLGFRVDPEFERGRALWEDIRVG